MSTILIKTFNDPDGVLMPLEFKSLSFIPKRVFVVSGVPKGIERGHHAHYETIQFLICLKGKIETILYDGKTKKTFNLNPFEGIYVEPMIWDSQIFCTGDDILLSICSTEYDKKDYIEDIKEFERLVNEIQ